jgi:hypothetical protein
VKDLSHIVGSFPEHPETGMVIPVDRFAEVVPLRLAMVPLDPTAGTGGSPVAVRADHGRWIVTCPDCNGAQATHPADKRFLCNECGNVGNARLFRPVVWPKDPEKIGELLDARADVTLRNWSPGETVADLTAENDALAAGHVTLMPGWAHPKWEGHTHRYPKSPADGVYECRDCGLETTEGDRAADIEAGA